MITIDVTQEEYLIMIASVHNGVVSKPYVTVGKSTALLKVHNDMSLNLDTGKVTALTILDLSLAFDTIV